MAPPPDLRAALAELGDEVMAGASVRAALRELLRRGISGAAGLDELTRRVWERRARIQRRHRLDGTVGEVKRLLEEAVAAERRELFPDPSDDARFREARLATLSSNTAEAVTELADYDWRSSQARTSYRRISDLLGSELLEQRFRGVKKALRNATTADLDRVARMLAKLNALLEAHASGQDTSARFAEFMAEYGHFFPERPADTDELVDVLAARAAAARRMARSMSTEQRAELAQLTGHALGNTSLAAQLDSLDAQLERLRPGLDWQSPGRFRGSSPLGLSEGARAMAVLAELDALAEQLGQAYPGARLEDIDVESLVRHLGEESGVDVRRLADLERQLRRQRLVDLAPDGGLLLTPKALRHLGDTALRQMVDQLRRRGERDSERAGAAGEPTGATKPWQFGDAEPWDAARTVRNAVLRTAAAGDGRIHLDLEDLEVVETAQRARAVVALCVDTSWSMVQDGHWAPMKRTALALHQLISTRFRTDALELITFGRYASVVDAGGLISLEGAREQGTNLHHALLLAGRHIRRHPDAQPVILVVTDGEPTAHLEQDGSATFDYPTPPRTLAKTIAEIDRLARAGASITVFRLGADPGLAVFVDVIARRGGGRVIAPGDNGLGAAVIGDYLRGRRR